MDKDLESMFTRAEELLGELEEEYNSCLHAKNVSHEAIHRTHEVLEKLKSTINHTMTKTWTKIIAPGLSDEKKKKSQISFPTSNNSDNFRSALGRMMMKDPDKTHGNLYDFLLSKQPFSSGENQWIRTLSDVSGEGKHIRLIPQIRVERRRIRLKKPELGEVSWDLDKVKFGEGVKAKIGRGVIKKVEIWVSFILEGYGINALGFCKEAYQKCFDSTI